MSFIPLLACLDCRRRRRIVSLFVAQGGRRHSSWVNSNDSRLRLAYGSGPYAWAFPFFADIDPSVVLLS